MDYNLVPNELVKNNEDQDVVDYIHNRTIISSGLDEEYIDSNFPDVETVLEYEEDNTDNTHNRTIISTGLNEDTYLPPELIDTQADSESEEIRIRRNQNPERHVSHHPELRTSIRNKNPERHVYQHHPELRTRIRNKNPERHVSHHTAGEASDDHININVKLPLKFLKLHEKRLQK